MWRCRLIKVKGERLKVKGERLKVKGLIILSILIFQFLFFGCENTTFRSSVPAYPVRVVIDTRVGAFVHFQPTSLGSHVVVNKDGYFLDDQWVAATSAMDAWGYGGVIVYVSSFGYNAYDLACPYCAEHGSCQACTVNGMNAVCPHCGEEYDLMSGTGVPQKGIAHEALRKLNIMNSDGRITVTQQ